MMRTRRGSEFIGATSFKERRKNIRKRQRSLRRNNALPG
jgi:hypothetical protein